MKPEDLMNIHLHFKVRGNMRNLHPTTMPLWSLVKGIRENQALADLTATGRELDARDHLAFKEWKPRNLMAVYFGARFRNAEGRPELANVSGYTGLAGFDFDDVDAGAVLEKLREVPQVACAGISASGKGVWCVTPVAAATASEYAACFADGIAAFRAAGFTGLDVGAHDPTRARFAASCPECWWRWDAEDIPAFQPVGDLSLLAAEGKRKGRKVKIPKDYRMTPELAFGEARMVLAEAAEVADGDRNTAKASMCGKLKAIAAKAGVPPSAFAPLFIEEWDKTGSTHKKTVSIASRLLVGGN